LVNHTNTVSLMLKLSKSENRHKKKLCSRKESSSKKRWKRRRDSVSIQKRK